MSTKRSRGRPKGETPAMAHVNIRVPVEVLDFFKQQYTEYTSAMRDVLVRFAQRRNS